MTFKYSIVPIVELALLAMIAAVSCTMGVEDDPDAEPTGQATAAVGAYDGGSDAATVGTDGGIPACDPAGKTWTPTVLSVLSDPLAAPCECWKLPWKELWHLPGIVGRFKCPAKFKCWCQLTDGLMSPKWDSGENTEGHPTKGICTFRYQTGPFTKCAANTDGDI